MSSQPTHTETPAAAQLSAERIRDEHRALGTALAGLERTTDPQLLLPQIEALRTQLVAHFESEEGADGLEEVVGATAPHLLGSLENIFDDHRRFLAELDTLGEQTRALLDGPLARILQGIAKLGHDLREHEARETELVSDAFYTDLGRGL